MKLHEAVIKKTETLLEIQDTASTFLEYLASDKFSGENDWIRTWEIENVLKEIRSKAIGF